MRRKHAGFALIAGTVPLLVAAVFAAIGAPQLDPSHNQGPWQNAWIIAAIGSVLLGLCLIAVAIVMYARGDEPDREGEPDQPDMRLIREHDKAVNRGIRELFNFVDRRSEELNEELESINEDIASRGMSDSGERLKRRAAAKRAALRELRDRSNALKDLRSDAIDAESESERLFREATNQELPVIPVDEINAATAEWEEAERPYGGNGPVIEIELDGTFESDDAS
ncbi:MAG: hypothetical protein DCC49_02815 [Acidobacteria bacterium]|nr:MAG: hypothetical protein DCC49_02815 [Acidobacteriota bacterium]